MRPFRFPRPTPPPMPYDTGEPPFPDMEEPPAPWEAGEPATPPPPAPPPWPPPGSSEMAPPPPWAAPGIPSAAPPDTEDTAPRYVRPPSPYGAAGGPHRPGPAMQAYQEATSQFPQAPKPRAWQRILSMAAGGMMGSADPRWRPSPEEISRTKQRIMYGDYPEKAQMARGQIAALQPAAEMEQTQAHQRALEEQGWQRGQLMAERNFQTAQNRAATLRQGAKGLDIQEVRAKRPSAQVDLFNRVAKATPEELEPNIKLAQSRLSDQKDVALAKLSRSDPDLYDRALRAREDFGKFDIQARKERALILASAASGRVLEQGRLKALENELTRHDTIAKTKLGMLMKTTQDAVRTINNDPFLMANDAERQKRTAAAWAKHDAAVATIEADQDRGRQEAMQAILAATTPAPGRGAGKPVPPPKPEATPSPGPPTGGSPAQDYLRRRGLK